MATFKVKSPSIASRPSLSCARVPVWSPHRLTQTGLEPSLHAGHIVVDLEILASPSRLPSRLGFRTEGSLAARLV